jgi:hypothetical protein
MELENDYLADLSSEALRPDAHRRRWQWQSPLGLLLVGFGASLLGQATLMKRDAADGAGSTWAWVAAGTASLVALNAGLSLFGDAVKHRSLFEMTARLNRETSDTAAS